MVIEAEKRTAPRTRERPRYCLRRVYTYQDYLAWPEDFRAEIVDGEVVIMPTPVPKHQDILMQLSSQLNSFLKGKEGKVYPAPLSVRLFPQKDDSDIVVFEPDIIVVLDRAKIGNRGIVGVPEMLVEILSPSTALYDRTVKLDRYEEAGVQEYWIIDPDAKTVTAYVLKDGLYDETIYSSGEAPVGILPGCSVKLADIFN